MKKESFCKIREENVTIVRNLGDFHRTYWTVEVDTHFTKKEAEDFYIYVSMYNNYLSKREVTNDKRK